MRGVRATERCRSPPTPGLSSGRPRLCMRMLHVGILAATRLPVISDYGNRRKVYIAKIADKRSPGKKKYGWYVNVARVTNIRNVRKREIIALP